MTETVVSIDESKRFIALEQIIAAGKRTFIEVGLALAEVRDSKLYRSDYKTFDDYCREKWGWDKTYCTRLIGASEVSKTVPIGTIHNEAQARELAKVEPAERAGVLEKAAESGNVTAKSIREAAAPKQTARRSKPAICAGAGQESPESGLPDNKSSATSVADGPNPSPAMSESEPAKTDDAAWLKAIGKTDGRKFFAVQVEDVVSASIADASKDQLHAVKLALEVGIRRVIAALKDK